MSWELGKRRGEVEENLCAAREDLCNVLIEDMASLYQLSYLLAGDQGKAEQCFVAGIHEDVPVKNAFTDWARSWAKLTIIKNAIRALSPRPAPTPSSSTSMDSTAGGTLLNIRDRQFILDSLLALPDFERFVFVMSVLERLPDQDCAFLLGCSADDVRNARLRTLERIAASARTSVPLVEAKERSVTTGAALAGSMIGQKKTRRGCLTCEDR